MPAEIYEIVAQGARYWFLFLMALIVWRSYRWYRRDQRQRKKRLRLLPDAGYVGEMVVLAGGGVFKPGTALPVPREGTLGYSRMNDLCVPVRGVEKRHTRFRFEPGTGLSLEPFFGKTVTVDGQQRTGRRDPLVMGHGSRLSVGEAELRLRLFAGFEAPVSLFGRGAAGPEPGEGGPSAQAPVMTPEQFALWQQQALQQQAMQMAYMQWMAQNPAGGQAGQGPTALDARANDDDDSDQAYPDGYEGMQAFHDGEYGEDARAAAEDGGVYGGSSGSADAAFAPPARFSHTEFETDRPFYPPEAGGDGDWPYAPAPEDWEPEAVDDDLTDAAAPPKSAYVGHDEAAAAKRRFWDRYLGGGGRP